jgi:hypothetical protein
MRSRLRIYSAPGRTFGKPRKLEPTRAHLTDGLLTCPALALISFGEAKARSLARSSSATDTGNTMTA